MTSCDLPNAPAPAPGAPASRVLRFQGAAPDAPFAWAGVGAAGYKAPAANHCGVTRAALVGGAGERTAFHLRYFEVEPGGHTTLERHAHEHAVVVLRGRGEVRLGDRSHPLGFGDVVYVAPHEAHQLRNPGAEPFGFLCVVDAERDAPVPVGGDGA